MNQKILELLRFEGPALSADFRKASIGGRGTPQEVSDLRENAVRDFLSRYFPFPYRMAKGNIIDSYGCESDSVDCVVLHPTHPHTTDRAGKFNVILADAVHAAIEVKPSLGDVRELQRAIQQVKSVKVLTRQGPGLFSSFGEDKPDVALVDLSKRVPCFLFADAAKADPVNTARDLLKYQMEAGVTLAQQIDFIVVNGKGIISNYKHARMCLATDGPGLYREEWGEETLAAFLMKLNWILPPQIHLTAPVLDAYLDCLSPARVVRVRRHREY